MANVDDLRNLRYNSGTIPEGATHGGCVIKSWAREWINLVSESMTVCVYDDQYARLKCSCQPANSCVSSAMMSLTVSTSAPSPARVVRSVATPASLAHGWDEYRIGLALTHRTLTLTLGVGITSWSVGLPWRRGPMRYSVARMTQQCLSFAAN